LPGAAFTEKDATYVNTEGRVQRTRLAAFPPGEAREDWKILRALSEAMGAKLPYDNLGEVRARLAEVNPGLAAVDRTESAPWGEFGTDGETGPAPFVSPIDNFYMTDPISRSSETMAKCTEAFLDPRREKADG
jgi:NADH-quinone oxidoreductase subunit G